MKVQKLLKVKEKNPLIGKTKFIVTNIEYVKWFKKIFAYL